MQKNVKLIRANVRRMRGYTPGEQPTDAAVVKLNTNENPYPPAPGVGRVLRSDAAVGWRLYPDPLCRELRAAIAGLHGVGDEQVFVGNGSDEILGLCTRAFVEDNGVIGYFEPSYSLYAILAQIRNAAVRPVILNADFDWPDPDPCAADLFLLTNPNAPSGRAYPGGLVAGFCRAARGVVVVDEAYVDFASADCMEAARRLSNVLILRSFSKSYSLAGLRAGYAVGHPGLIAALYKVKDSYNVNRLTQLAALAAVRDQPHMLRNVERIRRSRRRLARELSALGFRVWPSEANFLWVRPPAPGARRLYEQLKRCNILVRYFPGRVTGHNLRVTIGTEPQNKALLRALRQILCR